MFRDVDLDTSKGSENSRIVSQHHKERAPFPRKRAQVGIASCEMGIGQEVGSDKSIFQSTREGALALTNWKFPCLLNKSPAYMHALSHSVF